MQILGFVDAIGEVAIYHYNYKRLDIKTFQDPEVRGLLAGREASGAERTLYSQPLNQNPLKPLNPKHRNPQTP